VKRVETRVTTARSPEDVYAYLADFNHQAEWRFDVISSELTSGEPGAVGSHYRQLVQQGRKQVTSEVEVTEAEPHRRVAFRTVGGPVTVSGVWRLEPDDGGTRVDTEAAIEMHGLLKLFEPFSGGQLRKTAERYEAALAERLGGTPGK
jgi:carbon monoxide dehydrogenase subunit G